MTVWEFLNNDFISTYFTWWFYIVMAFSALMIGWAVVDWFFDWLTGLFKK